MAIGSDEVEKRGNGTTPSTTPSDRGSRLGATAFLERLPGLLNELRKAGFSVGVDQHVAVNELLIGLAARQAFPLQDPIVLGRLLCPLFAQSPLQQEIFAAFFENWLRRLPATDSDLENDFSLWLSSGERGGSAWQDRQDGLADSRSKSRNEDRMRLLRWHRHLGRLIALLTAIGLLCGVFWGAGLFHHAKPISPTSKDADGTKGEPARVVRTETAPSNLTWITAPSALLLLALLVLLRRRMDIHLQRKIAGDLSETTTIQVQFPTSPLFKSNSVAKASYDLRRSRLINQDSLDPEATVQASVRAGGFLIPVSMRRRIVPEYLVLIDRRTFADQSTALAEALLARLAGDGVALSIYYFDRSARFCFPRTMALEDLGRSVPIEELADRYADTRLLVFADPLHILQSGSNHPQTWIRRLAQWESPALFVRRLDETTHLIHQMLRTLGFSVFPATENGLQAYADLVNGHREPLNSSETSVFKHQSLEDLFDNESVWLGHREPDLSRVDRMLEGVRDALGETGFVCLSACAIYPEIKWKLTVYLVREICRAEGSPESPEDLLGSLAILPWLRHARMPDWLRVRLITGLEPRQEKIIRHLIENIFLSSLDSKADPRSIFQIARDNPSIRSKVLRTLRRQASDSEAGLKAIADPFREHIFATFLASRLSFRLPRAVLPFVYNRSLPVISPAIRIFKWSMAGTLMPGGRVAIARVLALASLIVYLLALVVPAIHRPKAASESGWDALFYAFGFGLSFLQRMGGNLGEFLCLAGALANVFFAFGIVTFICRVFFNWSWPGRITTGWISGLSLLCASATIIFVLSGMRFRVGFFLWILSPILLFVANLFSPRPSKRSRSE